MPSLTTVISDASFPDVGYIERTFEFWLYFILRYSVASYSFNGRLRSIGNRYSSNHSQQSYIRGN